MKYLFYGGIASLLAWFDLFCKKFVEQEVKPGEEIDECDGKVIIRHVHNRGFAMNMAEDKPQLVKGLSMISLGSIIAYVILIWKNSKCLCEKLAASFVLAGGISNIHERFKKGYVVDYLGFKTKWKKFNRITFNLGDMFIFLGGIILIIKEFKRGKH